MRLTSRSVHDRLAELVGRQFRWKLETSRDPDGASGMCASVDVPGRSHHVLRFKSAPSSVAVSYDDGGSAAPAEQTFVFEPHEMEDALAHGVVHFLRQLLAEDVVVVRERIPAVRSKGCSRFRRRNELTRQVMARTSRVYSWNKTYDRRAG
jgi:hypothetical protein